MVVRYVSDMLTGGIRARIVAGVGNEVRFGHLVLLFMFHYVFHHCCVAAGEKI